MCKMKDGDFAGAKVHFTLNVEQLQQEGVDKQYYLCDGYEDVANCFFELGDYTNSQLIHLEIVRIAEKRKWRQRLYGAYVSLSKCLMMKKDYVGAKEILIKYFDQDEEPDDTWERKNQAYLAHVECLVFLGNVEGSISRLGDHLAWCQKSGNKAAEFAAYEAAGGWETVLVVACYCCC